MFLAITISPLLKSFRLTDFYTKHMRLHVCLSVSGHTFSLILQYHSHLIIITCYSLERAFSHEKVVTVFWLVNVYSCLIIKVTILIKCTLLNNFIAMSRIRLFKATSFDDISLAVKNIPERTNIIGKSR